MKTNMLLLVLLALMFIGCATTYTNRNPVGEMFPQISGQTLEEAEVEMPDIFLGSEVVLLLGYKMDSQFDIDRWLIGLDQTKPDTKVYELPTIQGLFPRMFQTFIDEGMRSGIPKELWGGVITIYSDGASLQEFTGNENPNNARAMLLNKEGRIVYFHDTGFSVPALNSLKDALKESKE